MDFLDGSKPFLAAADDRLVKKKKCIFFSLSTLKQVINHRSFSDQHQASSSRPFTPFSSRLGSMVHELHRLLDFIPTENSISVQCQLVKVLSTVSGFSVV